MSFSERLVNICDEFIDLSRDHGVETPVGKRKLGGVRHLELNGGRSTRFRASLAGDGNHVLADVDAGDRSGLSDCARHFSRQKTGPHSDIQDLLRRA